MPFQSRAQQRFAFGTKQPWAKRWAKETNFAGLPERKDAGTTAGAPLAGPGGLLATPGMGRARKWGNRKKLKACTCGVNIATKEQIAPGITRIRGNLCNVHGRYGPCDPSKPTKAKPRTGRGRKPAKAKKPVLTPEQRAAQRAQQQTENRAKVLSSMGIAPDGQAALEALRSGQQADPGALARGGFEKAGLVEQAQDGSYRLTASGRAMLAAANQGDAGRAGDTISGARDRTAARTQRQADAAKRKQEAAARRAAAAAKKPKAGGARTGGSRTSSSATASSAATREQERQAARRQRQQEHAADRAQRQAEHAADRARQLQEHEQDRAARQQKPQTTRAAQPVARSRGAPLVYGHRQRGNAVRVKASDPGDYLIVEDRAKPSTYHLQVKKNGTPDHRLMGAAWAALHGGYRGNTYQGPNKDEAISKLRKLYKREGMPIPGEKSFTVFKSADGPHRWIARTTTAYRDRDGEIITTKALDADAVRMTATRQYGPLRYWHIGQPDPFDVAAPWGAGLDIGDCDYSIVIGRTAIESGTFKSAAIGAAFAASADDYELSPGFFHPPDQPNAAGEFTTIRRFERSVVPVKYGRASNLFTGMTVKEHRMDEATYKARVDAYLKDMRDKGVPPEVAAGQLAGMEQADKSAQAQGIAYKSDEPPPATDPWAAVVAALKAAVQPADAALAAFKAPPMMADEETPAEDVAEGGVEEPGDMGGDGGDYIGDMSVGDFQAMITELLAPVLKMQDMHKSMSDMMGQMKGMYATKDAGTIAEIAALKARLAELEGSKPAVTLPSEVEAALKSGGPQTPNATPQPTDPIQSIAMQTLPQLYQVNPQTGAWNGWAPPAPIPPTKS